MASWAFALGKAMCDTVNRHVSTNELNVLGRYILIYLDAQPYCSGVTRILGASHAGTHRVGT